VSALHLVTRAVAAVGLASGRVVQSVLPKAVARPRWVRPGRAHIAVRGLHRPGAPDLPDRLQGWLAALPGVTDVGVMAPLGRVIVHYLEDVADLDAITAEIAAFEAEAGLAAEPFAPVPHPGDWEPLVREATLAGANIVGAAAALMGRTARLPSLPHLVPVLVSLTEYTPALRGWVERGLRPRGADVALGYGAAVTQTLAQRPLGLLIDATHRANLAVEALAYRRGWQRFERTLAAADGSCAAVEVRPRPVPLDEGPAARAAAATAAATAAAAAAALLTARGWDRPAAILSAGVLRPVHLAREAFCAQLGRSCAHRGMVVLDPAALRRLDRVDVVVLDRSAVLTGDCLIEEVVPIAAGLTVEELYLRAHALVDLGDPRVPRERDGWAVSPLGRRTAALPDEARDAARNWKDRGGTVLRLDHDGELAGLAVVAPELDPFVDSVVQRARTAGEVLIAGRRSGLDRRLAVDGTVRGGARLAADIVELQRSGRCVALVSARGRAALAAADVGIAVVAAGRSVSWTAHVLCPRGLADAYVLLDAPAAARRLSARALRLALAASATAVVVAALGPAPAAARRSQVPLAAAAGLALVGGSWYALTVAARPPPSGTDRTAWHAMPVDLVLRLLRSAPTGLGEREAAQRHRAAGTGTPAAGPGILQASADELANPVTAALGLSAAMSFLSGAPLDAALIGTVLGLNAFIGALQRLGADRALRRLSRASSAPVRLHRDGNERVVTAADLVPGDVIELHAGDAVPADCRVLSAAALEVDESALTGESQPVVKTAAPSPAPALADRHSMLYEGTAVAAGSSRAVVTATGDATQLGRASRVTGTRRTDGVQTRLRTLMRVSVPVSVGAGLALFGSTVLRGGSLRQAIGPATNLAVAAVPEGLPFVATVAELAAARRLSRRGALVRRPATLEALGRTDVLCFDKTGTLTEGFISLRGVSDGTDSALLEDLPPELRLVVAAALRATPADGDGPLPHATDRAVAAGARRIGVGATEGLKEWRRIDEVPFGSGRGLHAVLGGHGSGNQVVVKGAPEVVLDRCSSWRHRGAELALTPKRRRVLDTEVERLARRGYRVLAVAERAASDRPDLTDERIAGLQLVGLLRFTDAVRPTARAAVRSLRDAGVQVVMVTGDHPGTASAIAEELGILSGQRVVTGPDLDGWDDAMLNRTLPQVAVFARTTPEQKARIVEGLRSAGRTVAVTGDGANDAPAIRLAHVGVALGAHATAAAREAADIVVTDDRIETIVDALLEGRAMWASVRDAITILLGGNLGEILFTLTAGLLSGATVLNTRQLMLVNLLTDVLPAMAIAVRPPPHLTRTVLAEEGPESSLGSALTEGIAVRAGVTALAAGVAWAAARLTGTRRHAATVGLVALVAAQLGQTFAAGVHSPLVAAAVLLSLAALVLVIQVPIISVFFGCRPLGPLGWTYAFGAAIAATALAVVLPGLLRRLRPAAGARPRTGAVSRNGDAGPGSSQHAGVGANTFGA
jgi:cation-transporting ATPase I